MLIVSAAAVWFLARRAKPHRERQLVELVGQEATFQVIAKIPSRIWVDLRLKQACGRKAFHARCGGADGVCLQRGCQQRE